MAGLLTGGTGLRSSADARDLRLFVCRKQHIIKAAIQTRVSVLGSGVVLFRGLTLVCVEKLFTVVVPSKFTLIVAANPSVVSVVNTGIVPAAFENMLNANVLPDVETPSGELKAGP